jgi:hypothetical protein
MRMEILATVCSAAGHRYNFKAVLILLPFNVEMVFKKTIKEKS